MSVLKERDTVNEYQPHEHAEEYTEREKDLIRKAWEAGREYEASLFSDVLNTIVLEVKRYREASKCGT